MTAEYKAEPAGKVRLTVYRSGDEYFATRTLISNLPDFVPPGTIFSITDDVVPGEQEALDNRVKAEARRLNIKHVNNLD